MENTNKTIEGYTKAPYLTDFRRGRIIFKMILDGFDLSVLYPSVDVYDECQLCEIYLGFKEGLDVSSYADPNMCSSEMRKVREELLESLRVK